MENNRKLILINPSFQLKFCFFISSLVFVSSLIYPLVIYSFLEKTLPMTVFQDNVWMIIGILTTMQMVFAAMVFIVSMFQSHKIAGPLYKLNQTLRNVANGHRPYPISFRKGDHFSEVAESYNLAIAKISSSHQVEFAQLAEIASYIKNLQNVVPDDKRSILQKIVSDLSEIQKKFEL